MDEEAELGLTLSIGAVSRATGVPANTLRTWERRYGFPKPLRTDGGQRAYSAEIVPHLMEIARALDQGLRPREALTASREELARWAAPETPEVPENDRGGLFDAVLRMDGTSLKRGLRMVWADKGGVTCMDDVIAPLVRDMGQAWVDGKLAIHQEHYASEVIRSFLMEMWRPLADTATGPVVVCSTPSGEVHDLGLHFAATTLALCGRQLRYLGPNTPTENILAACRAGPVEACALSVSVFMDPTVAQESAKAVAVGLPTGVTLLLGGSGAPRVDGALRLQTCASLYAWARPRA